MIRRRLVVLAAVVIGGCSSGSSGNGEAAVPLLPGVDAATVDRPVVGGATGADAPLGQPTSDGPAQPPPPMVQLDAKLPDIGPLSSSCADLAAAICGQIKSCQPWYLENLFGTDAACIERERLFCATYLAAPTDVGWTNDNMRACIDGIKNATCSEYIASSTLGSEACRVPGKRHAGAGCSASAQCDSLACAFQGGTCGVCEPVATSGQPCIGDEQCPAGSLCSAHGQCAAVVIEGGACSDDAPCLGSLRCIKGACARPGEVDAACESDNDCADYKAIFCNTTTKKCARATAGTTCKPNADGTVGYCGGSAVCQSNDSCVPRAPDGAACVPDGKDGAQCLGLSACNDRGTCVGPTYFDCPAVRPAEGYPLGGDPFCNGDPMFPRYCPARGDQDWGCWLSNVNCSSVTNCNGMPKACTSADNVYDCAKQKCSPTCGVPVGGTPCDVCAATKCCAGITACGQDNACRNMTGNNWNALAMCAQTFCPAECKGTNPKPPAASNTPPPPDPMAMTCNAFDNGKLGASTNDGSTMKGPAAGSATTMNGMLRKQVVVTARTPLPGFTFEPPYLLRNGAKGFSLLLPVRYTGSGVPCDVHVENIVYQDGTGAVIPAAMFAFQPDATEALLGSLAVPNGQKAWQSDCLPAGELGYVVTTEELMSGDPLATIAKVEVDLKAGPATAGNTPAKVRPTCYAATMDGKLTVKFQNSGSAPVVLPSLALVIGFDDNTLPTFARPADVAMAQSTLAPQAQATVTASNLDGTAVSVRAVMGVVTP